MFEKTNKYLFIKEQFYQVYKLMFDKIKNPKSFVIFSPDTPKNGLRKIEVCYFSYIL